MRKYDDLLREADDALKYSPAGTMPEIAKLLTSLSAAIRELRSTVLAEGEAREVVATLHDDGCFTWKRPSERPHQADYAGWRMDVYAAPIAPPPAAKELPFRDLIIGNMEYRINWWVDGCDS